MADLAKAKWLQRDGLKQLVDALGAEHMRWVGGAIRDTLLGLEVHDVDCATTHLPDEVIRRCKARDIRIVPTGIDHGTVTAIFPDGPVEITTLRRDVSTDGRRATVAFAQEWQEDAARRDFTINALYAHPETLEISDYFGGLADLKARNLRFIGDAAQRIREDHLRILRYFRFQARFGAGWDEEAITACQQLAETLKGLSRERVSSEVLGILALPSPGASLAKMRELGVLEVILPEVTVHGLEALEQLIAAEQDQGIEPLAIRRMAALLPTIAEVAETVSARLRFSKAQRARLVSAAERKGEDSANAKALAYNIGQDEAIDRLLLLGADISPIKDWQVPQFPLKGGAIVARGVAAGPEVARIMQAVERQWVAEGFPEEPRIQQLLDAELAGNG